MLFLQSERASRDATAKMQQQLSKVELIQQLLLHFKRQQSSKPHDLKQTLITAPPSNSNGRMNVVLMITNITISIRRGALL